MVWIGPDGTALAQEDWSDPALRTLGMLLFEPETGARLCLLLHGGGGAIDVTLPPARSGHVWRKAAESFEAGPIDAAFPMPPRSAILLVEAEVE